ncbi:haloacid dehalogenase type II [Nocardia xishanensis]|uniref:haloacid dehalogenase type II n=1 Tax=Nocardia xishanensis TaxID=238964 RepID=UPI00083728B3|nr:haloacid dehalogenase type II [Nocardia xishanensis]
MGDTSGVRALLFDVQGTATDFHSTVLGALRETSAGRHPHVDWAEFVDRWRAEYFEVLRDSKTSRDQWTTVHSVYRDALDRLLPEYGVTDLGEDERESLARAWQRIVPWPDAVAGLARLKTRFTLATLSNADVAAVVNISKLGGLPWDAIFTAEMAGAFKPDPATYRMAATYLGLAPEQIMMVACHKYDIRAAGALGFRTAFVARPLEFGAGGAVDVRYEDEFDFNARDFLDLADQLGC